MSNYTLIENLVFNNLDDTIDEIIKSYEEAKENPKKFINILQKDNFSVFFLHSEPLLDLIQEGRSKERLQYLQQHGFFLLTPIKTSLVIGKSYEVSYCKNNTRIINKNLTRFGYIFVTKTSDITKSEDTLLLCNVVVEGEKENVGAKKRLVELSPGLFLFFNGKASHQALLLNNDEN